MTVRRLLLASALRCYPQWWRDRYEAEADRLADDLAREGRSATGVAMSFARDGLKSRFRATPLELRPDAEVMMQRGDASVLSAWAIFLLLASVALGAVGFDPALQVELYAHANLSTQAGMPAIAQAAFAPLAVGAVIFLLSLIASLATTAFRAARRRRSRNLGLSFVPAVLPATVVLVGFWDIGELHGGLGLSWLLVSGAYLQLLGRLLSFHMGSVVGPAPGVPFALLATLSWLAIVLSAGVAGWSIRRARIRVGLPRRFLQPESLVTLVMTIAMAASSIGFVVWGIVGLPSSNEPFCLMCAVPLSLAAPEPVAGMTWWVIVGAMGLISIRAALAAQQSLRGFRQLPMLAGDVLSHHPERRPGESDAAE